MNIDLIPIGADPPNSINVIIEVPIGGEPVKYEFDKKSGAIFVDRILHTSMRYPANYGFIPHTLSPDGDPLDALVIARSPFIPGCVVRVRPIAVLKLEDEAGGDRGEDQKAGIAWDEAEPVEQQSGLLRRDERRSAGLAPEHRCDVGESSDLPSIVLAQIEHFFTHYKDLEPQKWVRIGSWGNAEEARQIVVAAIEAGKAHKPE